MAAPVPAADGLIRVLCISSPDPADPRRCQITQMFDEVDFELHAVSPSMLCGKVCLVHELGAGEHGKLVFAAVLDLGCARQARGNAVLLHDGELRPISTHRKNENLGLPFGTETPQYSSRRGAFLAAFCSLLTSLILLGPPW